MYKIFTRSTNEILYSRMARFLPAERLVRCAGFDGYEGALDYLLHILETVVNEKLDFVVNIDEDCFVYDFTVIEDLMNIMRGAGFHYAGVPDKGVIQHRNFSANTHNPFFNIFNVQAIRGIDWAVFKKAVVDMSDIDCVNYEPFDSLFIMLRAKFKPLDLTIRPYDRDNITTDLGFALHSWYSREYGHDDFHTRRIDRVYEEAKELCRKL